MRVAVLIPSFNEASNLPSLFEALNKTLTDKKQSFDLILINDGSTDETMEVVSNLVLEASPNSLRLIPLNLPFNVGVGAAMRTGFEYAAINKYDFAIQVDADGQHSPSHIYSILEALISGQDLVIGSRFLSSNTDSVLSHTSRRRSLVLKIVSRFMSLACKQKISDSTSGFRGVNSDLMKYFASDYPSEYLGDTLESLIMAKGRGFQIKEIPVVMLPRLSGKRSQNRFKSSLFLLRAILNIFFFILGRKR